MLFQAVIKNVFDGILLMLWFFKQCFLQFSFSTASEEEDTEPEVPAGDITKLPAASSSTA